MDLGGGLSWFWLLAEELKELYKERLFLANGLIRCCRLSVLLFIMSLYGCWRMCDCSWALGELFCSRFCLMSTIALAAFLCLNLLNGFYFYTISFSPSVTSIGFLVELLSYSISCVVFTIGFLTLRVVRR